MWLDRNKKLIKNYINFVGRMFEDCGEETVDFVWSFAWGLLDV